MSDSHIYLLQCNYARIEHALSELRAMCTPQDLLVLMEDSVFALQSPLLADFKTVYVLGDDHQMIADIIPLTQNHIRKTIDYDALADLISDCVKIHTWR